MGHSKPLLIELFAGLHGWGEGSVAEGFRVVGFDIFDMCRETGMPRPAGDIQLVLQDVLTLHGSQFKDAALIVASPPCQAYSYRAMPWKRAKALPPPDNSLFEACFRIQREACEAAGRHIPLVVENVRGAQKWVGRSRWNFGSFHLWGDVPALMPIARAIKNNGGSWFNIGSPGQKETNRNPVHELAGIKGIPHRTKGHWTNPAEHEGVKQAGISGMRDNGKGDKWFQDGAAKSGSKSKARKARKAASAQIAKIPFALSSYIARTYRPDPPAEQSATDTPAELFA